jgi:hypothetical protein
MVTTVLPDAVDPAEVEQYQTDLSWKTWLPEQTQEVWRVAREGILSYLAKQTNGVAIADFRLAPELLSGLARLPHTAIPQLFIGWGTATCMGVELFGTNERDFGLRLMQQRIE